MYCPKPKYKKRGTVCGIRPERPTSVNPGCQPGEFTRSERGGLYAGDDYL